jgi:hypothetical protein
VTALELRHTFVTTCAAGGIPLQDGIYGEGQNRTGDTTILSQGPESPDLGVVAGAFLIGPTGELPLVSIGFGWVWVVSGKS